MKITPRRRPRDLILDIVFVAWAAQFLVSGQLLPSALRDLIRHEPSGAAVADDLPAPRQLDEAPVTLPET